MDIGVWDGVFVQAPLHGDEARTGGRLWLDLHGRRDGAKFVGIVRPAFGWDLSRQTSVFAGYAAIPSGAPGVPLTVEHRVWQQLLWSGKAGSVDLGLRPRLEQRFGAGTGDLGLRGRLFGRVQVPVPDVGRTKLAVVAWDEVFVGLVDSALGPAGFDQNRLFVGPAVRGEGHRIEVGFLHQLLLREGTWSSVGVAAANLFVTL